MKKLYSLLLIILMASCVYDAGADDNACEYVNWQADKELRDLHDRYDKVDPGAIKKIEKKRINKLKELGCYGN